MEMKKRISFSIDQIELMILCLKCVQKKLGEDLASGSYALVAGPYSRKHIGEIVEILSGKLDKLPQT
jgi:hypothetical protein